MSAKDHGTSEVQKIVDKAEDKGFIGIKVDPIADREYSILSGPDSPTVVPDAMTRLPQHSHITTKEA